VRGWSVDRAKIVYGTATGPAADGEGHGGDHEKDEEDDIDFSGSGRVVRPGQRVSPSERMLMFLPNLTLNSLSILRTRSAHSVP
jgi:hypothetical protein